ncbi:heterokaryon incompatibility protein-domain-containing protein [Rhexocercosporidium sp. MPI-PUGE-AT-0058]|nr:heterokaryon incompatibility protein-domain-containing protein [Rhexocercosporidium sp. MPI-PUGE-AT-0058]
MLLESQTLKFDRHLIDGVAAQRLAVLLQHLSSSSNEVSHHAPSNVQENAIDLKRKSPASNAFFAYPRLSEREITRLVILEPGEPHDELRCRLKHIHSLQDHDYEALSYVWGEHSTEHMIQYSTSGTQIPITANLDCALRQLRYADRSRLLWVDAISINQDDLAERSQQVRMMQEIYANATQVVIWLGQEAEGDVRAFASLRALESTLAGRRHNDSWLLVRLGWYRDRSGRVFSGGAHRSMVTDIEYEHLITIRGREWFRRTWVIQEVASSQKATVYCGNQSIPWEIFADVYMKLGDRFLPVSQLGGEDAHHSLENITAIERARRSHAGPLSMSLFHVLLATSLSQCKDDRDKIFAVRTNEVPRIRGMRPEAWHSHDKAVLHVTGIEVDTIAILGSEPAFTKAIAVFEINAAKISALRQSFLWLQECETLAQVKNSKVMTEKRRNQLCRTVTCGLTGEAFPAPKRYLNYFNRYMEFISSASERFQDYLTEFQTTVSGIRGLDEVVPNFKTHATIEASLDLWSSRRRFSVTRFGQLACVPKGSRVGDVICVVFGGEVPYVLRPAEGGFYTVVGECYVDDIMHGESLSYDTVPREFRLR